jgi:hypothetical protein
MPHFFTNAEYADMLYVYGFCDGSATAAFEECRRRFPMHRIPDRRVFSMVFNTFRERGTLPSAYASSERARQQYVEEQENIREMVSSTIACEDFLQVSMLHKHVYGEHFVMTLCTYSVCKIYTDGTVPCV